MDTARVPWRTIWATIASVLASLAAVALAISLARVLLWMAIAGLVATILGPAVDLVELRLRIRRGFAIATVIAASAAITGGMIYVVARPLVNQGTSYAQQVPDFLKDARAGKGTAGSLVKRFNLEERLSEKNIHKFGNELASGSWSFARQVGNALVAMITIITLTLLMLARGPRALTAATTLLEESRRNRVRNVGRQCAKAVSGYMIGNLLISLVAGTASFVFLTIAGVPFAGVLAVFVAITDLIPLIGATLGAVAVVLIAFIDSPAKGIAAIIFCLLYQIFENNVLSVAVMARTVHLDPLVVLVSMLVGVELLGFVGAFAAIPVAGMVQVIVRDLWRHRKAASELGGANAPAV